MHKTRTRIHLVAHVIPATSPTPQTCRTETIYVWTLNFSLMRAGLAPMSMHCSMQPQGVPCTAAQSLNRVPCTHACRNWPPALEVCGTTRTFSRVKHGGGDVLICVCVIFKSVKLGIELSCPNLCMWRYSVWGAFRACPMVYLGPDTKSSRKAGRSGASPTPPLLLLVPPSTAQRDVSAQAG
eukprot:1161442-Pelagomonas_calceolata.AAC.12